MPHNRSSAENRTRQILEDLEAVRENLLALSDDIWKSIDRQDVQAFDEGVRFMRAYIETMTAFDRNATDLSEMIQQYTSVSLGEEEQAGFDDTNRNERIVEELNREEPHKIDEDFTFKRPHGFILDGQGTTGVTTWRRLFELTCHQLLGRDQERFQSLPDHPDFVTSQGHRSFSRDPNELRSAALIADEIYAEINLSANGIRDTIRRLLTAFEIPEENLQIFLREDRDAGKDQD